MNLFVAACDYHSEGKQGDNTGRTTVDEHADGSNSSDMPGDQSEDETGSLFPEVIELQTVADLRTRGDRDLGDVVVWNDTRYLYVKFSSTSTLLMTYLAVESSLEAIPQTKNGNPKLCRFEFKTWHTKKVNEYTYKISIQEKNFEAGSDLFIAAHALVKINETEERRHEKCSHLRIQPAWAEGFDFPGKCWATYFTHRLFQKKYQVYYNGSLVASYDFPVIVNNRTAVDYYSYGDTNWRSYNGDIILNESNVIQTFILQDMNEEDYLVVVFDAALDGSGGAADVNLTSEGLADRGLSFVVRDDSEDNNWTWDDSLGASDIGFKWSGCCTDGFVLGPLPKESNYTLDLKFSSLSGLNSAKTHFSDESLNPKSVEISTDLLDTIRLVYLK